jgi:hypothetical protein
MANVLWKLFHSFRYYDLCHRKFPEKQTKQANSQAERGARKTRKLVNKFSSTKQTVHFYA